MEPKQRLLELLLSSVRAEAFVKLTLGFPVAQDSELRKLILRPALIRGERMISIVSRFNTRDETKNYPPARAVKMVDELLGKQFLSAHLFTESEEVQVELGRKNTLKVRSVNRAPATLGHDRLKSRWVNPEALYLKELGVTDGAGKIRERMGDKFRQIERFVDLLASAYKESELETSPASSLTICDMGAGKGYLTFAAFDFLRGNKGDKNFSVTATGVEFRPELVHLCNQVAQNCEFEGLSFVQSNIQDYPLNKLDILIALHACNTATDDALAAGVRAGAHIILAAPCCHKELRQQICEEGPLSDVLRHGIFAERHAEMATDALRCLILEHFGYRVRISEFVAPEHTAKNVMLIATKKRNSGPAQNVPERLAQLKEFYGIKTQRLEQLLLG